MFIDPDIITDCCDYTLRQFNVETGDCEYIYTGHIAGIYSLKLTIDRERLLSACVLSYVYLWNITNGRRLATYYTNCRGVFCIAVTPDGKSFVTGCGDRTVKLWNFDNIWEPVRTYYGHTLSIQAVAVSDDGKYLYSCGKDHTLRWWNIDTCQMLAILNGECSQFVSSIALRGNVLACGSYDNNIKLFDVSGSPVIVLTLFGHEKPVKSVAISPDGTRVAAGGADKVVTVWDVASGELLWRLEGHTECVFSVSISSDNLLLVSGAYDNTVRVWDLESGKLRTTFPGHVTSMSRIKTNPHNGEQIFADFVYAIAVT
jgi:WD40 repeat protein